MATRFKNIFFSSSLLLALASCGKNDGYSLIGGESDKNYIFMTAASHKGDFGGPVAADALCMSDSNYPGEGTYKAMVSDFSRFACSTADCSGGPSENNDWVLAPNTTYHRLVDGALIGTTNANGLFSLPLTNSMDNGPAMSYWTGLSSQWQIALGSECNNWTDNGFTSGFTGISDALDSTAIHYDHPNCSTSLRLICVEQ